MTSNVQVVPWSDVCACGIPWADLPVTHWRGATFTLGGGKKPVRICQDNPDGKRMLAKDRR